MPRVLATILFIVAAVTFAGCGGGRVRAPANSRAAARADARYPGWRTDFAHHSVALNQFRDGGPPRDGIPPIDHPHVVTQRQGDRFLDEREPVMVVEQGAAARAYPLQILVWHEIVNDRLAGRPIAVTYCPLCNSGIVFDRRVDGRDLTFGTTGKLRRSDLVMWDRQTQSWWQQFSGEALVGTLTGRTLRTLASQTLSWQDFKHIYPHATVLSRDTGFVRDYGRARDSVGCSVERVENHRPPSRPLVAYEPSEKLVTEPSVDMRWMVGPLVQRKLPQGRPSSSTCSAPVSRTRTSRSRPTQTRSAISSSPALSPPGRSESRRAACYCPSPITSVRPGSTRPLPVVCRCVAPRPRP